MIILLSLFKVNVQLCVQCVTDRQSNKHVIALACILFFAIGLCMHAKFKIFNDHVCAMSVLPSETQ